LATRDLRLVPSHLESGAGIAGAAAMTIDRVLSPHAVDELLSTSAVESVG
jgi:hypothetical protein